MKKTLTITIITGYFLLIGVLGIVAAVPAKAAKISKENVHREIIRNISCPAFVAENNDVRALVNVDENGKVTITDINSTNSQLLEYVNAQLQNLTIKNMGAAEKFILIIHFKKAEEKN